MYIVHFGTEKLGYIQDEIKNYTMEIGNKARMASFAINLYILTFFCLNVYGVKCSGYEIFFSSKTATLIPRDSLSPNLY